MLSCNFSTFALRIVHKKSHTGKVLLALAGIVLGLVLLLLVAVVVVLCVPSARQTVLDKGIVVARQGTGMDIDLGRMYLSPFHHSPKVLWRAYKGEGDLPLTIEIDSLFVGHRGEDTLLYTRRLRLNARLMTADRPSPFGDILSVPVLVERLLLDRTTFHSDSLIETVGVDVVAGRLEVSGSRLLIAEGDFPLHGLCLDDAYIGISLRDTPPDTTAQDTTPALMAFDVPDGELRNVHFALEPTGLHVRTDRLSVNVLADVGGNLYDARRLDAGGMSLAIGNLYLPFDTLYGDARVDLKNNLITSKGLHARSDGIGATADLYATAMDLETMRVDVQGDAAYQGSKACVRGYYDIDNEAYDIQAAVERVDLSAVLKNSSHLVIAGDVHAEGEGIDPGSQSMKSKVRLRLKDAVYNDIDVSGLRLDAGLADRTVEGTLHLPVSIRQTDLRVQAETEHRFRVAEFMTPERMRADYNARMCSVRAHAGGEDFDVDTLDIRFATAGSTRLEVATRGLNVDVRSPMHVLRLIDRVQPLVRAVGDSALIASVTTLADLNMLDTLRRLIPDMEADIVLTQGSPVQHMIERAGLDVKEVVLSLNSDQRQTELAIDASIPEIIPSDDSASLRLPAAKAAVRMTMTERRAAASVTADSRLTDGAMNVYDLCTDAAFCMNLTREDTLLRGSARLTMDSLSFNGMELGTRAVDIRISPSQTYRHALRAEVNSGDILMDVVDGIVDIKDIDLFGAVRLDGSIDGLPQETDISARVLPIGVSAEYKPYEAGLSLDGTPIIMEHNLLDLNGLRVYGADSTFISLTGGLDLNHMRMDVTLVADSFAPAKLPKGGPIPVYGELAADIRGKVTGPLDSIVADVDVTILPTTDITYPIDRKNLAQVRPRGTVNVRYGTAESVLGLGGRIDIDEGVVRYSPKIYPVMPFKIDSGSHITFFGSLGQTRVDVSASQKVKASSQSEGENSRLVDFTTGVRVHGTLDSIGLNSIGFFLEAPDDEVITSELASVDEDTREGLAATLLATGMYMGESNVSAHQSGYALTSIINSRINAAMANSKLGKVVDIDLSSAKTHRAVGETNDLNIAISKSFFEDRLRLSLGAALSDNPEAYKNVGFLNNISAEYKLNKKGTIALRAFGQRDYNNIFEGELIKSGLGVRATKEWRRQDIFRGDSLTRTYGLTADADVAWRSNNSLGPNLTLTHSIRNLIGRGETFTVKGNGAYYWALRNRHPGDPKKTDTYKLGVSSSLVFPYLHWLGDNNPAGDTRYMLGYQYENIAGGYGVHKFSGSFSYFIRSSRYVTHAFTPLSLSVVRVKAESDSLMNKAAEYPQLLKILAGDEFVPSIGYNFIYNDYRSKRVVNTMLDLGVKESANLINAVYCLFGHKWDEPDKKIGGVTFNQFVKLTVELRNKFNITDNVCFATRIFAGANIPTGSSSDTPLSEAFYAGGLNSMRGAAPYAYGPGNFYSTKYNQNFFHAGDIKLEANCELRFPIVWKLYGAAFVDAGNVWNWLSTGEIFDAEGLTGYKDILQLREDLYDGIFNNPYFLRQIALGTGAGLRLDLEGLVIRLDLGVGIHTPYQTFRYDKEGNVDTSQPITTYYNIPSALEALRLNFGIGYPF